MNKQKIKAYMFLLWTAFYITGCSGSRSHAQMYLEAKTQEDTAAQAKPDQSSETDGSFKAGQGDGSNQRVSSERNDSFGNDRSKAADSGSGQDTADVLDDSATCFVYVCGAVKHAGVFELPQGSRVYEAIALAGGFRKNAYEKGINQARLIQDGDMIEVLTIKEQKELGGSQSGGAPGADSNNGSETGSGGGSQSDGLIDINTATVEQLMTLSGIGEAKAANIISYRESIGGFLAIEEIKNVSGIGEGVYAKIQDKIKVS